MDLFSPKLSRSSERVSQIKAQVAGELGLDEHATVMVSELTCREEANPSFWIFIRSPSPSLPGSTRAAFWPPAAVREDSFFGSQASGKNPMLSRVFRLRFPLCPGLRTIARLRPPPRTERSRYSAVLKGSPDTMGMRMCSQLPWKDA